jgi:hypothetical protein
VATESTGEKLLSLSSFFQGDGAIGGEVTKNVNLIIGICILAGHSYSAVTSTIAAGIPAAFAVIVILPLLPVD